MAVDVILGLQWGDEGKGKIVDYMAPNYDMVCRFQGGPNAGHTLHFDGKKFVLHTIPSGIFREGQINVIGGGVVVDPITLCKELDKLDQEGLDYKARLLFSEKAHLILPTHRMLDKASELSKGKQKIGSTLKGIGPTYMDKTGRNGLRLGDILTADFQNKYETLKNKHLGLLKLYPEYDFGFDLEAEETLWMNSLDRIRAFKITNTEYYINNAIKDGKQILAEGAQGSMLDIDHGTYPFVTSSNTLSSGVCSGLGVAPRSIRNVFGITKAYCTRVGSGPFPTELFDAQGEKLQRVGHEFGATTGRPRRCGWIDLVQLNYTCMLNGVTDLIMTKLDVLNDFDKFDAAFAYEIAGAETKEIPFDLDVAISPVSKQFDGWNGSLAKCETMADLPNEAKSLVSFIEQELHIDFSMISIGPNREELLKK